MRLYERHRAIGRFDFTTRIFVFGLFLRVYFPGVLHVSLSLAQRSGSNSGTNVHTCVDDVGPSSSVVSRKGYSLGLACVGVALLHFVVHLCVLEYMVKPMADQQEDCCGVGKWDIDSSSVFIQKGRNTGLNASMLGLCKRWDFHTLKSSIVQWLDTNLASGISHNMGACQTTYMHSGKTS